MQLLHTAASSYALWHFFNILFIHLFLNFYFLFFWGVANVVLCCFLFVKFGDLFYRVNAIAATASSYPLWLFFFIYVVNSCIFCYHHYYYLFFFFGMLQTSFYFFFLMYLFIFFDTVASPTPRL